MAKDNPLTKLKGSGMGFLKRFVFDEATLEPDNRRDNDRTPVVGEIKVVVLNAEGEAVGQTQVFVRDLSKTGCGLWSRVRFAAGTRVVLHFPPTNGQPPLARMAEVCHSRGQDGAGFAVGCRFVENAQAA